jgi:hypothetical protein
MKKELTQSKVHALLDYDEYTGEFRWVEDGRGRQRGDIAGNVGANGYIYINISGGTYPAHRLAWLWYYGAPLPSRIKHINGNPKDNYINNLTARGPCDW